MILLPRFYGCRGLDYREPSRPSQGTRLGNKELTVMAAFEEVYVNLLYLETLKLKYGAGLRYVVKRNRPLH